ncbi:TraF protein [Pusillimonas sp. T7-7]|uniref:type IV secretion system protein n=1 Tax=Pusillimonas sp. (strain T7-7) TaxID=1007105 RepID=UPI0002084C48|nr:type IV secretion system protein [Pusillimonas sp. T7-7]AEC18857.1 TraF protein [Pusillimonas sp. T7-7]
MKPTLKWLQSLAAAALVCLSIPAHGQIPVTDGASITARAAQHAESLAKYLEQIATLKAQLESAHRQYEAITGARNLGDILNNPTIRNSIPADVRVVLRRGESSIGSIQHSVNRIRDEERLTGNYAVDSQALSRRVEDLGLRSQALLEQAQEGIGDRMLQLDQLQQQINLATDPKAISDLQARLQVEQANIQADQIRADLLSRQLEAEKVLIEQQSAQLVRQSSLSVDAIRAPIPDIR